jgi:prepilin-type N-terminal cleavage/methylation domain-containing protein
MTTTTFIDKLRNRLASEEGFSMIELLTVIIILSTLALIAIPSYSGFKVNAQERTAELNVNTAIPIAVQYYTTNNDSYAGLSGSALATLSPGISPNVEAGSALGGTAFCIQDTEGGTITYAYPGGAGGSNVLTEALCNGSYNAT